MILGKKRKGRERIPANRRLPIRVTREEASRWPIFPPGDPVMVDLGNGFGTFVVAREVGLYIMEMHQTMLSVHTRVIEEGHLIQGMADRPKFRACLNGERDYGGEG